MSMDIEDSRSNLLSAFEHKKRTLTIVAVVLGCVTFACLVATIVLAVQKADLNETLDGLKDIMASYSTSPATEAATGTTVSTSTTGSTPKQQAQVIQQARPQEAQQNRQMHHNYIKKLGTENVQRAG